MKFWFPNSSGDPITVDRKEVKLHRAQWFTPVTNETTFIDITNSSMPSLWAERVEDIKRRIKKNEIVKEIAHWDFTFKGNSPVDLIMKQDGEGRFIVELENGNLLYGNSPELVLKKNNKEVEVEVLGGTNVWNKKTSNEHSIIVSDLIERFPNELSPSQTEFIDLGYIKHLRTKLKSTWDFSLESVIPYVWPNLAITGKGYGENHWGTLIGWGDERFAKLWLCIRCGVWDGEFHKLRVGCGITEDSDPEEEWEEINNKLGWINLTKNQNNE